MLKLLLIDLFIFSWVSIGCNLGKNKMSTFSFDPCNCKMIASQGFEAVPGNLFPHGGRSMCHSWSANSPNIFYPVKIDVAYSPDLDRFLYIVDRETVCCRLDTLLRVINETAAARGHRPIVQIFFLSKVSFCSERERMLGCLKEAGIAVCSEECPSSVPSDYP